MSPQPSDVPPIEQWDRLLDGKVALVTGGGDGIGGAVSRLFAQHGAVVEIAEIDPRAGEATAADITAVPTTRPAPAPVRENAADALAASTGSEKVMTMAIPVATSW